MITVKNSISLGNRRRILEMIGLSTDTKPTHWECVPQPTKEQFEANETHYYTLSGTTYTQCSDGDSYVTNLAVVKDVHTSATVSVTSATYLGQTTGPMELECVMNNATKSVEASDESFSTDKVTLTKATLFEKIKTAGTHDFIYDGDEEAWTLNDVEVSLADYGMVIADGVTITDGDKIKVTVTVKWQSEGEDITLATYGITVSGNATEGDSFAIDVQSTPKVFHEAQQINGSTFHEINTKKNFMFNEDAGAWVEQ